MQDLRVADPEKFGFKPKRLLAGIAQIYLNLAQDPDFIRAVANDGRSYSKELFEKFARILKNRAIMTDAEVSEVVSFTQKVEDMKATIMIEDEREIPDEFLGESQLLYRRALIPDPLLSTRKAAPNSAHSSHARSRHPPCVSTGHRQIHNTYCTLVKRTRSLQQSTVRLRIALLTLASSWKIVLRIQI